MQPPEPELPTSARDKVRIPLQISGLPPEIQLQLEETLLPSPHSVDLLDTPRSAYLGRLLSREPHTAELYHLNSSLASCSETNQVPPAELIDATREWFFSTSYRPAEGDVDNEVARKYGVRLELDVLEPAWKSFFRELSMSNPDEASLYSVDLWLVIDQSVYRLPARTGVLWKERDLSPQEMQALSSCVVADHGDSVEVALLWVGAPWRHMVFRGPRGYRHTLIEFGRQTLVAQQLAAQHGLRITTTSDFLDDRLNSLFHLDGAEHAALGVSLLSIDNDSTQVSA